MSDFKLPFDYMNAAGWVKTVDHVRRMVQIPFTSHVIVGGFTLLGRDGSTGGTNFVTLGDGSYGNALSLPNHGVPGLRTFGREMTNIIHDAGKKAVLNASWFEPQEAGILADAAAEAGFEIVENNNGCPNVRDGGKQKHIPSYHPELMEQADEFIDRAVSSAIEVWDKFSPYVNPADRIRESERVIKRKRSRVTVINTVPNFRPRNKAGKQLITATGMNGYCGLSGAGAKWLGVINAEHFVELLEPHGIKVNGTTGICSGSDLQDYISVGCCSGQVGGAIYASDSPEPLAKIAQEWAHQFDQ